MFRNSCLSIYAAKADMAGRGIDRFGMACGGAVAAAIVWRAQMRTALQDLARNFDIGLTGVVASILAAAARILRNATGFWRVGLVLRGVPVGGPFPDIADHVVDAVAVRRECVHWRRSLVAVEREVLVRECALPSVGHLAMAGREFVTPGELGAIETAARRKFPLGFGRQYLAGPLRVSLGIPVGDVHHRMVIES